MFLRALARRARGFATCWSCDADLPKAVLSCEFCGRIQPLADTRDFFAILKTCVRALVCRANERERERKGETESLAVQSADVRSLRRASVEPDMDEMQRQFRAQQRQFHPDLFSSKSEVEKPRIFNDTRTVENKLTGVLRRRSSASARKTLRW